MTDWRLRTTLVALAALPLAWTTLGAQRLVADSARSTMLFRESAAAALSLPPTDTQRIELLRRIARAQVSAGDIAGAMITARPLGIWRREVQTNAACRLLEARRFDDAYALVRRFPRGDRDWALAHLASQLAGRPSPSERDQDTLDTSGSARRALAVAAEVRMSEARADALISIAWSRVAWDSTLAVATFNAALAVLAGVRDVDFVSTRRQMIASGFGRVGQLDAAFALVPQMLPRDRLKLGWHTVEWKRAHDPRVRSELRRLIPLIGSASIPESRSVRAQRLVWPLRMLGDSALADSLAAVDRAVNALTDRAIEASVTDRAVALARSDIPAAIAMIDTLDDPLGIARRAKAYVRLARVVDYVQRDMTGLLLVRARQAALDALLGVARRDAVLAEIAEQQVRYTQLDDAIRTIDAIHDPDVAVSVLFDLSAIYPNLHHLVARLSSERVRTVAIARIIERSLQLADPTGATIAWSTTVADSLPPGPERETAQVALARLALARRDTAAARARLLPLLEAHRMEIRSTPFDIYADHLLRLLVQAGETDATLAWARGRRVARDRAAALLEVANAIVHVPKVGGPIRGFNGADRCREGF